MAVVDGAGSGRVTDALAAVASTDGLPPGDAAEAAVAAAQTGVVLSEEESLASGPDGDAAAAAEADSDDADSDAVDCEGSDGVVLGEEAAAFGADTIVLVGAAEDTAPAAAPAAAAVGDAPHLLTRSANFSRDSAAVGDTDLPLISTKSSMP